MIFGAASPVGPAIMRGSFNADRTVPPALSARRVQVFRARTFSSGLANGVEEPVPPRQANDPHATIGDDPHDDAPNRDAESCDPVTT